MTNDLVAGRLKGGDPLNPTFTKTVTLAELLLSITQRLPVDTIYYMVPHEDGRGYSMRECGTVVIDIIPSDEGTTSREATKSPKRPIAELPDATVANPSPQAADTAPTGHFEPMNERDDLSIAPPKSQAQLLAERGLEQPLPSPKPKRKSKNKCKSAAKSDSSLEIKDEDLPNPVSRSSRKVSSIRQATPQEAAAASKFGKV